MLPGQKFRHGIVEVFGYPVQYAEAGAGEVIVSLPGSAGLEMSTAKDMLAERYRVIEVNPPGWGGSAAVTATMEPRDVALILTAAIAELNANRYHLIGTSMSGTNAFWAACHHPHRVRSLILEGPMTFVLPENLVHPEGGPPPQNLLRSGSLKYDPTIYPAPPPHPRKAWATADFFHEQMARRFKNFSYTTYPGDQAPLVALARKMPIPVTLVLGTADEILRLSYADRFKAMVPSAECVIVDGATHDVQNTAPEAFVEAVKNTMRRT